MYAQCTKYIPRSEPTPDMAPREADWVIVKKRSDMEKKTEGASFWGNMAAEEGKQTHPTVWKTSNSTDYPKRVGSYYNDTETVRQRANFMRTQSITLGDDRTAMKAIKMAQLSRDNYVGRSRFMKNGRHTKTKSDLYICPAEIENWKQRHLVAMSHRQFQGPPAAAVDGSDSRQAKAIQKEMLTSHVCVGNNSPDSTERWLSLTQSDYKATPASAHNRFRKSNLVTSSSISLANYCGDSPVASKINSSIVRPNTATQSNKKSKLKYPSGVGNQHSVSFYPRTKTVEEKQQRSLVHTQHSWKLGYDGPDPNRYVLYSQSLLFT